MRGLCVGNDPCVAGQVSFGNDLCVVGQVERIPPNSPDLNPIENIWSRLDERLEETAPARLESYEDFKSRVGNAVRWLNESTQEKAVMVNAVESMPRRLAAVIRLKGAGTGY